MEKTLGPPVNGGRQPVAVLRHALPAPSGFLKLRYVATDGAYLGEVELFATNSAAARHIAKDLYAHLNGRLPVVGHDIAADRAE